MGSVKWVQLSKKFKLENYQNQKKEQPKSNTSQYLKYSGIGFQMISILCVAAFGGMWLDKHFEIKAQLFTIFLLIFAVMLSMYSLIKGLTANDKK
ncbi:MAG: AtpZ/AtpI family protein [Cytophagales bacterium]|nr:MAG: AtpZ/AtpI family protein [Cytophagales bacterium]